MAIDVTSTIEIARPLGEVADVASDPDRAPEWYSAIRSAQWRTQPPLRVGAEFAFVARFLGRRLEYTYRVVEFEPHRLLVMRTSDGPFPMETTYRWRSTGTASTEMTLTNRGEPAGFAAVVRPFMSFAVRRANRRDLDALKAQLERDAGRPG